MMTKKEFANSQAMEKPLAALKVSSWALIGLGAISLLNSLADGDILYTLVFHGVIIGAGVLTSRFITFIAPAVLLGLQILLYVIAAASGTPGLLYNVFDGLITIASIAAIAAALYLHFKYKEFTRTGVMPVKAAPHCAAPHAGPAPYNMPGAPNPAVNRVPNPSVSPFAASASPRPGSPYTPNPNPAYTPNAASAAAPVPPYTPASAAAPTPGLAGKTSAKAEFQPGDVWNGWRVDALLSDAANGKTYSISNGFGGQSLLRVFRLPSKSEEIVQARRLGADDSYIRAVYKHRVDEIMSDSARIAGIQGGGNIVKYEEWSAYPMADGISWIIYLRTEKLTPLWRYFKSGNANEANIVRMGIDICKALEVCWDNNIIHRDIRPESIYVTDLSGYKLGDFGITRRVEGSKFVNTPIDSQLYMAPEVFRGEGYSLGVDTYSLGLILYRLMNNNRLPFLPPFPQKLSRTDYRNAIDARLSGAPLPAPANAKRELRKIILKACAFNPAERYAQPSDMRRDLELMQKTYLL